jgi:hypothetical protein
MPDFDRSSRRPYAASDEGGFEPRTSQRFGQSWAQQPGQRSEAREPRPGSRFDQRSDQRSDQRFDQRLDQWLATGRQLVDGVAGARPGSRAGGRPQPVARAGGLPRPGGLGRWVEDRLDWLLEDEDGWREPWEGPDPGRGSRRPAYQPGDPEGGWSRPAADSPEPLEQPWSRGAAEAADGPNPARDAWAPRSNRAASRQSPGTPPSQPSWSRESPLRPQAPPDRRQDFSAPIQAGPSSAAPQPQARRPLEALSRRATPLLPPRPSGPEASPAAADGFQEWPDDASFTVSRWQRPTGADALAQAPLPLQPSLRPSAPGSSWPTSAAAAPADQAGQQRPQPSAAQDAPMVSPPSPGAPGRPVPRSSRRRQGY